MGASWGVPLVARIAAGAPVVLVRGKLAGVDTPGTVAMMAYVPAVPFALKLGDVASPFPSVVAVAVVDVVSENVALAPVAGAVKVTTKPLTGTPLLVTVATRAAPNAPFTEWL
jgi:hypothetical protein